MINDTSMFFTSGDETGCGLYRTRWPAEMLGKEWHYGFPTKDERINISKVIQIQRATHIGFTTWIPMAQARGQKIIYDIDDNLFEIPSYNPAFRPYNSQCQKDTRAVIAACDIMTVSTLPLKEYFLNKRVHNNIVVIPNFMHHLPEYREELNDDKIIIGYHGTITHSGDFDSSLVFALSDILNKYKNVYFECMGYNPLKSMKDHPKIKFHPFCKIDDFHSNLYNMKIDIGIAPLQDNEFNRGKSNVKYLEYSSCGTATIASNVYPYHTTITDGENGLLVKDKRDWKKYLIMLIEDVAMRKSLAKNAYDTVNRQFTYANNGSLIDELYTGILEKIL